MGEASKRLSEEFIEANPNLSVRKAAAMRNLLIHQYDYVDVVIVWRTILDDLPPYKRAIIAILNDKN